MNHDSSAAPNRRTTELVALLLLAAVAVVVYGWIAAASIGTIGFSDSADYLFFTDFYRSRFLGESRPEAVEFYRQTRFPPLFPLVLAAFGGGTHALQHTQVIACAINILMFACLWAWLRRDPGSRATAFAVTALTVLSPGFFLLTLNPVSEPLTMAMMWVAFLLATRLRESRDVYLLVALLAGLTAITRSVNIALVCAIPFWLHFNGVDRRRVAIGSVLAFLPFTAWFVYRRTIPGTSSYLDGLEPAFFIEQLGGWPDLLYAHPWRLVTGFAKNFDVFPDPVSIGITLGLLLLAATGWSSRLRARRLDAIFIVFYFAIILVWPYPREAPRFMTFVLPLVLLYATLGLAGLLRRMRVEPPLRMAAPVIAVAVLLASASTILHFFQLARIEVDAELRSEKRGQYYFHAADAASAVRIADGMARVRLTAREAARMLPPGECTYAVIPNMLQIHAPVRVVPYPRTLADELPIRPQLPRCDYLFVVGIRGIWPEEVPFYPMNLIEAETEALLIGRREDASMLAAFLTWKRPEDVDTNADDLAMPES